MNPRWLILPLILALGCKPLTCAPVIIKVPVAVPAPQPPVITLPHLPVSDLTADMPFDRQEKAKAESLAICIEVVRECRHDLDAYRTPASAPAVPR